TSGVTSNAPVMDSSLVCKIRPLSWLGSLFSLAPPYDGGMATGENLEKLDELDRRIPPFDGCFSGNLMPWPVCAPSRQTRRVGRAAG
ncbi:MAG: hypothetical protein ACRDPJ_03310, partial [Nocardioidaceae bacterium]